MAPGLNYGQQAYEGMKAFRHKDNTAISVFRPQKNAKRLQHSASYVSMPGVPEELFVDAVNMAVGMNAEWVPPFETGAAMYIRPLLFGSSAQLGLNPPDGYTFCVFVMPTGVYHGVHAVDALVLEDFDRAAPEGTGSAKVGGNYAPVLRHSDKARKEGYGITLHLDSKTRSEIDEFSTSGFIGVKKNDDEKGGYTLVVPDSKNVIDSVTSDSIYNLASKKFGFKVEKRAIPYAELSSFSEVMAAGTAAALVPIRSITMKSKEDKFTYLPSDEPGEVCAMLLKALQGIQRGVEEDFLGWNEIVKKPEGVSAAGGKGNGSAEVDALP